MVGSGLLWGRIKMRTYRWEIETMSRIKETGFVNQLSWVCWGFDGIYQSNVSGTIYYDPEDVTGTITPYEQLTEEQVIGWVKSQVNEANVIADIDAKIDAYIKPTRMSGTPWGQAEIN